MQGGATRQEDTLKLRLKQTFYLLKALFQRKDPRKPVPKQYRPLPDRPLSTVPIRYCRGTRLGGNADTAHGRRTLAGRQAAIGKRPQRQREKRKCHGTHRYHRGNLRFLRPNGRCAACVATRHRIPFPSHHAHRRPQRTGTAWHGGCQPPWTRWGRGSL